MAEQQPMDAERQQLREWLPLAANDTLAPELRARLEAGLARHPDLQHELRWLQTLRHTVQTDPLDALPTGDLGWSTLERRIAARTQRPAPVASPGWTERLRDWLQANFGPVLATACVLMVAQAVLIGSLMQQGSGFEAAGGKPAVQGVAAGTLLHVTLRAEVTEPQWREALRRFNATIVDGPSALGIYTLRVADGDGPHNARALAQRLINEAGGVFESAAPATGE